MLDEFVPPKSEPKESTPSEKPTTASTNQPTTEEDGLSDEDFAKQLQQGMAELLGGLENDPEMASQFEAMMKELTSEAAAQSPVPQPTSTAPITTDSAPRQPPSTSSTTKKSAKSKKEEPAEDFQETIRKTMERLNASGSSASAAAASSANSEEDLMAEMLKAMQASGFGGENGAAGSEEDFSKMLLGMMEQLTNKEILYEPMKELHDKFPEWMIKNEGTVKEEDMKRYKEQQLYVKEIVERFEAKGYSDDNAVDREYIVERMQKVCFESMGKSTNVLIEWTDASSRFTTPRSSWLNGCCPRSIWGTRRRLSTAIT